MCSRSHSVSKAVCQGLTPWLSGKKSACQCRRYGFNPCSGMIPAATEQLSLCTSNYRACALQQKNCSEKAAPQLKSSPHSLQLERSWSSNEDTAQPKINEKKNFFKDIHLNQMSVKFLGGKKSSLPQWFLHGAHLECLVTLTSSGIQILCFWFLCCCCYCCC